MTQGSPKPVFPSFAATFWLQGASFPSAEASFVEFYRISVNTNSIPAQFCAISRR
jgi:hypothetical protein